MRVQRTFDGTEPAQGHVVFYITKPHVHYLWFNHLDVALIHRLYPDFDFMAGFSYVQVSTDFEEAVKLFEHVVNTTLFVPLFYCGWNSAYDLEINTGT